LFPIQAYIKKSLTFVFSWQRGTMSIAHSVVVVVVVVVVVEYYLFICID